MPPSLPPLAHQLTGLLLAYTLLGVVCLPPAMLGNCCVRSTVIRMFGIAPLFAPLVILGLWPKVVIWPPSCPTGREAEDLDLFDD